MFRIKNKGGCTKCPPVDIAVRTVLAIWFCILLMKLHVDWEHSSFNNVDLDIQLTDFWMHMHPYTYLCPPARLAVCLSQLALSKDDINAHPLRPMSYWLIVVHY